MRQTLIISVIFLFFAKPNQAFSNLCSDLFSSKPLFARPLVSVNLSKTTQKRLMNQGINRMGDLVIKTEQELQKLGFGRQSLSEIKETLSAKGLKLGMRIKNWPPSPEQMKELTEQLEAEEGSVKPMTEKELASLLDIPIDVLKFQHYVQRKLKIYGITHIRDLVKQTPEGLLSGGLSPGALAKTERWLAMAGLHLGMDLELKPEETLEPFFAHPVENLNLSTHVKNRLAKAGIIYVGDLVTKLEWRLRKQSFGKQSLSEIKEMLSVKGLKLGMRIKNWPPSPEQMKELTEQLKTEEGILII